MLSLLLVTHARACVRVHMCVSVHCVASLYKPSLTSGYYYALHSASFISTMSEIVCDILRYFPAFHRSLLSPFSGPLQLSREPLSPRSVRLRVGHFE